MSHEIERLIRMASTGCWFIEPAKAEQIVAAVALRVAAGPRGEPAFPDRQPMALSSDSRSGARLVRVLRLHGTIMPRGNMLSDMSGAVSLDRFSEAFRAVASDPETSAILLDIDSPGGRVEMVQETVAMIRAASRPDRPIVAVANTLAASAAYWIASACDEIVVTPSGYVGSIGVYMMHQEVSERMKREGISASVIFEGARKVETNPFGPLDDAARAALQADVKHNYDQFTSDVAKGRGVPVSVVRADPETAEKHFGGGRAYWASEAVRLGMADRVATLDDTLARLMRPARVSSRRASLERRRLALL
ncbi:MAG: S49 family peptidase [Limimaricola sp.]